MKGIPSIILLLLGIYQCTFTSAKNDKSLPHHHSDAVDANNDNKNKPHFVRELLETEYGTSFQLKMYWEEGYKWNGSPIEKNRCMACKNNSCANGIVVLKQCDRGDSAQRWTVTANDKITPTQEPDRCITYEDGKLSLARCRSSRDYKQVLEVRQESSVASGTSVLQILGDGLCMSPGNDPEEGGRLKLLSCDTAEGLTIGDWVIGEDFDGHAATIAPTNSPTGFGQTPYFSPQKIFQIKLYWEEGYNWAGSSFEKRWCVTCKNNSCGGGAVILKECNKYSEVQKWTVNKQDKISPQMDPGKCLTYDSPTKMRLSSCSEEEDNVQDMVIREFPDSKFQILGNGNCTTTNIDPDDSHRLKVMSCDIAERINAVYWVVGMFGGHPSMAPTKSPTQNPTTELRGGFGDSDFQLKMYWEENYNWRGSPEEKSWCATCLKDNCLGGAAVLARCDSTNANQRWVVTPSDKISPSTNRAMCLTYEDEDRMKLAKCNDDDSSTMSVQRMNFMEVSDNKFKLLTSGSSGDCTSVDGEPYENDRLKRVSCNTALDFNAVYWVFGTEFNGHPSLPPSVSPTAGPTSLLRGDYGDDAFQLKVYWETGYEWRSSWLEKNWCAACVQPHCGSGAVALTMCDAADTGQRWVATADGKINPATNSTICLSYNDPNKLALKACSPARDSFQKLEWEAGSNGLGGVSRFQLKGAGNCITPGTDEPFKNDRLQQVSCAEAEHNRTSFWVSGKDFGGHFQTNNGEINEWDMCEIKKDKKCPCYPEDDDFYCRNGWFPWDIPGTNNIDADGDFEKCDKSKFEVCKANEKLCPMRKPRLDRYYNDDKEDVVFFIDYDCIQCVPLTENCSKCSPGVWCEGIGRCVAPTYAGWCRTTFPNRGY